jgi:hypothetical protein
MTTDTRRLIGGLALLCLGLVAYASLGRGRPQGDPAARLAEARRALEAGSAIALVPSPRPDLLHFEVRGRIARPDMAAMARYLGAVFDTREWVDILITMPGYDGVDLGAMFDREAFAAQLRSNRHVRRYAVVGPPDWAGAMIRALDPLTPVDARVFAEGEEAQARAWLAS